MARYRKIGGGEPTMNRNSDGNWYMCKGHSGCWYKLASGDDLPPTAGWTTGSEGRSPAPRLRIFNSAAEAKRATGHHSDRTGGAAIGDLVMVLPSARKKDGCVRPGEVGKFIKDDHDGQPFKVEKLDKSNSSYYYEGDMRKATDAEVAAKLPASALPPLDSSTWESTAGATDHPVFARSVPTTQGDGLKIVVTSCGNKSKCVGEYTVMSGSFNGKPWFRNPSGAIIYFRESWKMNDNDSKAGWYYSVTEMAPSRSTTGSAIAVGCSVRVRASVATPRYDWGPVSHASVGKLLRIDAGGDVKINFPEHSSWTGRLDEIEIVESSAVSRTGTTIKARCSVRVRAAVAAPRFGWGGVSHSSVGKVSRVDADGDVWVDFPECTGWRGRLDEIEIA